MLSFTRNGFNIGEPLGDSLRKAEGWGKQAAKEVVTSLAEATEKVLITFAGLGYGEAAAYMLYWLLTQLSPAISPFIIELEGLTYHTLAYREYRNGVVIVFVEEGMENRLVRLSDAVRLTGLKLVVVSPPQPPIVRVRLGEETLFVEVPEARPALYLLSFAANLGAEIAKRFGDESKRVERVSTEFESFAHLLPDVEKRYSDFISSMVKIIESKAAFLVSFTPTMRPPAALLAQLAARRGVHVVREPLASTIARAAQRSHIPGTLVLLRTDVEEDGVRELRFKLSNMMPSRQPNLIELHMKTDPLTAPLYASMVVEAINDRLK